jgi:hypothetical protein
MLTLQQRTIMIMVNQRRTRNQMPEQELEMEKAHHLHEKDPSESDMQPSFFAI